jgi:MFS family permease
MRREPRAAAPTALPDPSVVRTLRLTIALAVFGVFVTYVPITGVSVTLTTIRESTQGGTSDLQWVTVAYTIPLAATILSAGVFGDLYGRRRVYLLGMALAATGAAIAAVAGTRDGQEALRVLWAGQAIGGIGAGLLLPTTLALIAHAVPDLHDRAKYVALWASGLALGLAVGPIVAGVVLEAASWGWVFVPVVGLSSFAGVVAWRWLPESKSPEGRHLDWPGQVLATVAIAASIFGVIEGGRLGWGSTLAIGGLAAGGVALAWFLVVELHTPLPLVEVRLFRSPAFTAAGVAALVSLFAIVGTFFVLGIFFGTQQDLSPLEIGYRLLFINLVTALVNPVAGRAMRRFPPLAVLAFGLGLGAVAMLLLVDLGPETSLGGAAWRLSVMGIADAFMVSTVAVAAIGSVPHRRAGMAAATNTAMRQYGAALGPAVLGAILVGELAGGGTAATGLRAAFQVNAGALGLAAVVCAVALLTSARRRPSRGTPGAG